MRTGSTAGPVLISAIVKYDRVFAPGASCCEVFAELEESLIRALDGFNVTLLVFGHGGQR